MEGGSRQNENFFPEATFIGSYGAVDQLPDDRKQVCFLGRSNSGKSTLLSALMKNSSIVKTSKKPGATRTLNLFQWKGIYLVDTPGYGYAKIGHKYRAQLSDLINQYLTRSKNTVAFFLLLDCNRKLEEEEKYIIDTVSQRGMVVNLVLTKIDRLNQKEMHQLKKKFEGKIKGVHNLFLVSGKTSKQVEQLYYYLNTI